MKYGEIFQMDHELKLLLNGNNSRCTGIGDGSANMRGEGTGTVRVVCRRYGIERHVAQASAFLVHGRPGACRVEREPAIYCSNLLASLV